MNNFRIDITSEGEEHLKTAMFFSFSRGMKVIGFQVKNNILVLFWYVPGVEVKGFTKLPFIMNLEQTVSFVHGWLGEQDYGPEPDHDGDNGKGWRIYNEEWGHVNGNSAAFLAIEPVWAMYGK